METCDHGRGDERGSDEQTRPGRAHRDEQDLAEAESQTGGDKSDKDSAEPSRAGAIGPHANGHARKEWEGEHRTREEEPAEEADGGDAEQNADRSEEHTSALQSLMRN